MCSLKYVNRTLCLPRRETSRRCPFSTALLSRGRATQRMPHPKVKKVKNLLSAFFNLAERYRTTFLLWIAPASIATRTIASSTKGSFLNGHTYPLHPQRYSFLTANKFDVVSQIHSNTYHRPIDHNNPRPSSQYDFDLSGEPLLAANILKPLQNYQTL